MGDSDDSKDACGVFGIRAPGQPVSHLTYLGLYALQHRGQESAGIAVSDGDKLWVDKDMGLVSSIFNEHRLAALVGDMAIGHTRYSTTGASAWDNAQPVYQRAGEGHFALAHNGNLVNTAELARQSGLDARDAASDTHVVAHLLAEQITTHSGLDDEAVPILSALRRVLPRLRGGFCFTLLDEHRIIGVRDPNGFHPLFLGRLPDDAGWVLASETPALDVVGATTVREIEPGELVVVSDTGVHTERPFADGISPTPCVFEYVYFARPDGNFGGQSIHQVRQRMGELLADQAPAAADLVIPVPDSGIPAAQGYARASGIPYSDGLTKNRYIGRTFIAPTQELRRAAVRIKYNPIKAAIAGARLVVVEDSIVRGTTLRDTLRMLRDAGATEIHLRISSPPYRWPCFYGMDTGNRRTLLAADRNVEEIREYLGADSLAYLGLDRMLTAIDPARPGACTACLTGDYPVAIPDTTT